jgi:hypothetical protein
MDRFYLQSTLVGVKFDKTSRFFPLNPRGRLGHSEAPTGPYRPPGAPPPRAPTIVPPLSGVARSGVSGRHPNLALPPDLLPTSGGKREKAKSESRRERESERERESSRHRHSSSPGPRWRRCLRPRVPGAFSERRQRARAARGWLKKEVPTPFSCPTATTAPPGWMGCRAPGRS